MSCIYYLESVWRGYGQVAFFVVSGKLPLHQLKRHEISAALSNGQLPPEDWPVGVMVAVRKLAEGCRKCRPEERPCMRQVLRDLSHIQGRGELAMSVSRSSSSNPRGGMQDPRQSL